MSIIHDALKKVDVAGFGPRASSSGLFAQTQEGENGVTPAFVLLLGVFLIASLSWAYLQRGELPPSTGRSSEGAQTSVIGESGAKPRAAAALGGHLKNGIGLYKAGRLDDALAQLKLALEETPDNPVVHNNIGAVHAAKNEFAAAEQFFIKATASPVYAEAFNNRGAVVIKLGRTEEAIGHFKTALGINPGYADAHLNMAVAYERVGDAENAINHYRSYLDLSADAENKSKAAEKITALMGEILRKHRNGGRPGQ